MHRRIPALLALSLTVALFGCQTMYYDAMEKVGVHKRDIMVDRVEEARDSQTDAKDQFANALERFSSVVNFDGGKLEEAYDELSTTYQDCSDKAAAVTDHIDSVEDVAQALFDEWEEELSQYTSASLRRQSARQMADTKTEYTRMLKAMRRAEKSMTPVLNTMHDQVLFLKHNLNARAIASIRGELDIVKRDVSALIKRMETSINKADQFIKQMHSNG